MQLWLLALELGWESDSTPTLSSWRSCFIGGRCDIDLGLQCSRERSSSRKAQKQTITAMLILEWN